MGGEYGQDWPKLRLLLGIETSAGQAVASDRPTSPHGGGNCRSEERTSCRWRTRLTAEADKTFAHYPR
jgi:hypothetical protein